MQLKTISQNSSGGTDDFPAIFLKQCSKSLAHPLQLLYKTSLKTGEIPIDPKRAIIVPIYKGESKNIPKNYRHVALTCITLSSSFILFFVSSRFPSSSWRGPIPALIVVLFFTNL